MIAGEDPRRLQGAPAIEPGVMPMIARPRSGLSGSAIAVGALLAALVLFVILNSRRQSLAEPATTLPRPDLVTTTAPPPLFVPPLVEEVPLYQATPASMAQVIARTPSPMRSPVRSMPLFPPPRSVLVDRIPLPLPTPLPPTRATGGSGIVYESARSGGAAESTDQGSELSRSLRAPVTDRARAAIFANRATTVPQGTLIPAVLETGFDSTRAGFARALVQHDVLGFDGSRVLIPRGSRLFGEYQGEVAAGQKRALITWSRLVRPDGATIVLASPATDPVGRGGISAHVNTHFFQRFSGALLRSVFEIGAGLAARSANNSVVLALPGSFQGATNANGGGDRVKPTLTVDRAASVSVLVARDLDFTDVEAGR